MIAEVGGIRNVSGSRMATPFAPPRPGSTPMIVPSVMPTTAIRRLKGVIATWKPVRMFSKPIGQSPSQASTGPLGRGTRNQRSKITKVATGTQTASRTATMMSALRIRLLGEQSTLGHQVLVELLGLLHPLGVLGAGREGGIERAVLEILLELRRLVDLLEQAHVEVDCVLRHVGRPE